MIRTLEFAIENGDVGSFEADVVALKYAQSFYGVDKAVALALGQVGIAKQRLRPRSGDYRYVAARGCIRAPHVLFVGVPPLQQFGYRQIREFSASVLGILANEAPGTRHVAMTIHGPGYGLDEVEAVLAQFAGCLEAIKFGQLPVALDRISIVEINSLRVQRLRRAFDRSLGDVEYASRVTTRWAYGLSVRQWDNALREPAGSASAIESAGTESETKPHVFVAMPFRKDMDDVFYYGIQQPVHTTGFLCERIDQESFTGDILDRVKQRIETAAVVIAELTGANANVYLEVGYAWGKGRPTILLVKDAQELRFDVRGERCLTYERIKDLEESLTKELRELKSKGLI